jgi:DNA-binding CsgD family transcriptional regulator
MADISPILNWHFNTISSGPSAGGGVALFEGRSEGLGNSGSPRVWPFVGRAEELAGLAACLDSPGAGGVVLVGPPGIGKSSLARALRDAARDKGWPTEEIAATRAAASIPLGAFSHVLPDLAPGAPLVDAMARAVATLGARVDGDERVLVTVDDAHLLDDASAALVHRLARTPEVFLVATVRSKETAPDAIVALWKDELTFRVDVEPLTAEEIEQLVTAALGGQPSRALVHRVHEVSAGNPLFARELLLSGLEAGALVHGDGVWRWHGPSGAGRRLQEFVEERLERLSDAERDALRLVAFGEPLGVALLESIVGAEVVDALERQELVAVHREQRRVVVGLVHPVYAEALRAGTAPRQAATAQRRLADAVQAAGAHRREDRLRVALWRLESGGELDTDALLEAAEQANAAFDHVLAERLAWAAQPGGGAAAELVLARALWLQGKGSEAEAVWSAMAGRADTHELTVAIATNRSNNLFFTLGRPEDAAQVLDDAEAAVPDEAARLPLAVQRSVYSLYGGRPVEALREARVAIERPDVDDLALAQATVIAAPAQAITGNADDAVELVDRVLPLALALPGGDSTQLGGQLLAARFLALTLGGRLHEAADLAAAVHRLAIEHSSHDGLATMACAVGQVTLARGRPRTAIWWLREAASLLRIHDRNGFLPWCLGELAQAATMVGDLDEADAALAEADGGRHPSLRLFDVELAIGRAWRTAADGEHSRAYAILEEAATWAADTGQAVFAGLALHAAARLGFAAEVVERLEAVASTVDSREIRIGARHARALAGRDAAALEQVATDFEEMGAVLRASEAAAAAAAVHRSAGRARAATAMAERARALAEECQGAATPGLAAADEVEPVAALTRREEEVARLVARGLTSKEVADRLYLSVRTVDNHLQRAYTKLGVSSRKELAARLPE